VGDLVVDDDIRQAVLRVLDSGRFSEGPEVSSLEREWADYVGTRHAVAVSSGTSALISAILALVHADTPVAAGQRAITTPVTYAADSNAIVLCGMEPAYVDIDPDTFCIRPDAVECLLEAQGADGFGLILPVHLMGYPVDMGALSSLARKHGLCLVEDAAQAHGADVGGRRAGSWGDLSVFSFYIAHNIQAGELGVVNTNEPVLAGLVRQLKANGRACDCPSCTRAAGKCPREPADRESDVDPRFDHVRVGYNFKATEWSAAIARAQLARADEILDHRRGIFAAYGARLAAHRSWLRLPPVRQGASPFAYPLVIKPEAGVTRGAVRSALSAAGIESRPLFGCIPTQQRAFSHLAARYAGKLPVAEEIGSRGFYIGCHQSVTEEDVAYVGTVFDGFARENGLLSFP